MKRREFIAGALALSGCAGKSSPPNIAEPIPPDHRPKPVPMSNNTLLASDNFASGSLAAGWVVLPGSSGLCVVVVGSPNYVQPAAGTATYGQIWTGLTWPADQISELTLKALTVSPNTFTLNVRTTGTSSQSGYQCNVTIGSTPPTNNQVTIYKVTAGSAVQLATVTGTPIASADVWSLSAIGPCLTVYQNYKLILNWVDTTFTSGSPGFALNAAATTGAQVFSWRGYNPVEQDGIWQKLGTPAGFYPISTDINTGTSFVNSGIDSASIILHEGNAQILSGTVYKMWFGTASGIQYAESSDGLSWTRFGSTVIAGFSFPQVIKVGTTYYLYIQSNTVAPASGPINVYTSTNGTTWTLQNASVITVGTAGQWDQNGIYLFSPVYVDGGGTWWALYSGFTTGSSFGIGIANSSDGVNWTKRGGNPVATSVWASVPYLIGGVWYLWGSSVPPGIATTFDPTQGMRMQSPDLINWTNRIVSIKNTQQMEGVNNSVGFAYPDSLVQIGAKTYMYYEGGPANLASNTGSSWNLNLAVANATMAQIVTGKEDAIQQTNTDTFPGGPGPLSANWTKPTGGTALQIVAGPFVEPTAIGTLCQAVYTGAAFSANQYSEVTIHSLVGTLDQAFIEPTVRASTTAATQYEGLVASPSATRDAAAQIFKRVNGTGTQIGPTATITPQVGDVIRFSVFTGSDGFPVLSLFQNGWLILQVEDSASPPILTGNPGVQMYGTTAVSDAQITSWAGGNAAVSPFGSGASGDLGPGYDFRFRM